MKNTVLLVVDVQQGLINEKPYNGEVVVQNIKTLIDFARCNGVEVIYVRHDDGVGGDLEYGSDDWQIVHEIAPIGNEKIYDKKYNSSFLKTGLKEYLRIREVENIILVGLQTEYCIDATCKAAFEIGYNVIIPKDTNTTFDNEYLTGNRLYEFYNYKIWNGRFAKVIPVEEVVCMQF